MSKTKCDKEHDLVIFKTASLGFSTMTMLHLMKDHSPECLSNMIGYDEKRTKEIIKLVEKQYDTDNRSKKSKTTARR